MRTIGFLLQKEFRQIFRNKAMLPVIFAMPLVQLIILPLAADYEVRNISISVTDHDHSSYSQKLITKIAESDHFTLNDYSNSYNDARKQVESDHSDLILEIPAGFEKNLIREGWQKLFIAANAINGVKASLGTSYLVRIIADFNAEVRLDLTQPQQFNSVPVIEVVSANWFNPNMNYKFFMVPGILAVLVTMLGAYLCSMNIVKEKEIGTIEQINVTPIRKHHFILGKLIPFWIIGIFIFSIGLFGVGSLIYGIIPAGSILLLYLFLSVFLIAVLGFGLLISTYSDTQQQAMSVAFFFMMIFMLMSGLFTPTDSMPEWAKNIAYSNPVTYFIEVMRMIVLKGSGFSDIKYHFLIVGSFAVGLNTWAILNYKKTS